MLGYPITVWSLRAGLNKIICIIKDCVAEKEKLINTQPWWYLSIRGSLKLGVAVHAYNPGTGLGRDGGRRIQSLRLAELHRGNVKKKK